MQHVSTYSSHLQAKQRTVLLYRVFVRIWDSIWLTVFFIHNVIYIYCAIVSRVKCVWRVQSYLCPSFLCFWSSLLELGRVLGGFFVHLYFCMFLLSVCGAVATRFSAIMKSDIFIFCAQPPCNSNNGS